MWFGLKTGLLIAVMVAAHHIASWMAPELAATATAEGASLGTRLAFGALKGAMALGGTMLVNTIIPSPKPASPAMNWGGAIRRSAT